MPPAADLVRLSARVTGRVQGVGFRHFTRSRAHDLGLTGWVRNETDGSVQVEAEGPRDVLDTFLDALRNGPRPARVVDVETDWRDAEQAFDGFRVRT